MFDPRARLARHPTEIWLTAVIFAVLALVAGASLWQFSSAVRERLLIDAAEALAASRIATSGAMDGSRAAADAFLALLPGDAGAHLVVQRLAATATRQEVILTASRVEPVRSGVAEELRRGSLTVALRGSYPAVKSTLADALARARHATIHSLILRRHLSLDDVEAQVVLSLWARPLAVSPAPAN